LKIRAIGNVKYKKDKFGNRIYQLNVGETAKFELVEIRNAPTKDPELVALLSTAKKRNGAIIENWRANGIINGGHLGESGTITVSEGDKICTYKAPAKRPSKTVIEGVTITRNPVQLSVDLKNLDIVHPKTGKVFNNLSVNAQINIIGEFHFTLAFKYKNEFISGDLGDFIMTDSMNFKMHVKADGTVTTSGFNNSIGKLTPDSFERGGCTHKWVPIDALGFTVDKAEGLIISGPITSSPKDYIHVALNGASNYADWESRCGGRTEKTPGPGSSVGYIVNASFVLKDSAQTKSVGYYFMTVTPE
jgi:hypothetical protein